MKLANTIGIVMNRMYYHNRPKLALVYFIQGRLIVSGWLVWSGWFDYRSKKHRDMISPDRELLNKALRNYYEHS